MLAPGPAPSTRDRPVKSPLDPHLVAALGVLQHEGLRNPVEHFLDAVGGDECHRAVTAQHRPQLRQNHPGVVPGRVNAADVPQHMQHTLPATATAASNGGRLLLLT